MLHFARGLKRGADLASGALVGLLTLPIIAVTAAAVRLTSPGPLFFVQERVGLGERPFAMYKFRTMRVAPANRVVTAWDAGEEARITPAGRFLRDYGLDELPQVWNILRGDMSIVGPRPPLPAQLPSYTESQRHAFRVRPGVLSLAAVRGRRSLPVGARRDLHAWYANHWSLRLDLEILFRSLGVVLGRQDAVERLPGAEQGEGR